MWRSCCGAISHTFTVWHTTDPCHMVSCRLMLLRFNRGNYPENRIVPAIGSSWSVGTYVTLHSTSLLFWFWILFGALTITRISCSDHVSAHKSPLSFLSKQKNVAPRAGKVFWHKQTSCSELLAIMKASKKATGQHKTQSSQHPQPGFDLPAPVPWTPPARSPGPTKCHSELFSKVGSPVVAAETELIR